MPLHLRVIQTNIRELLLPTDGLTDGRTDGAGFKRTEASPNKTSKMIRW